MTGIENLFNEQWLSGLPEEDWEVFNVRDTARGALHLNISLMTRVDIFLLLAVFGAFLCIENSSYSSTQRIIKMHVEISDNCNTEFSRDVIESLKKAVNGKTFVLTDRSGVVPEDYADREKIAVNKDQIAYKIITDHVNPEPGDEKMTMKFNRSDIEGTYNADFLHFTYQADKTWVRGFNPGNFRFGKESSKFELRERLIHLLTGVYEFFAIVQKVFAS